MKFIELTRGARAIVDDEDYEDLIRYKWYMHKGRNGTGKPTARRRLDVSKMIYMHRYILGITDPTVQVDHINGNTLDNRRCNLRVATSSQNNTNKPMQKNNRSGYKGVAPEGKKWRAQIKKDNNYTYLGSFDTPEEASKAYNKAAKELHKEFRYRK